MHYSLKTRLIIVLSLSLIALVSGVSIALERAFDRSLTSQLNERLKTQLFMLLTAAEEEAPGQLYLPEVVREGVFNQIDSGSYAFVYGGDTNEIWRSFSAVDLNLNLAETLPTGEFLFDKADINSQTFYRLRYAVIWESEDGTENYYQFTLLHEAQLLNAVVNDFRFTLLSGLAFVLVAMLIIQLLALRWGLSPLNLIAKDLKFIEAGRQQTLSKDYPAELQPLTRNLNLLIDAERAQREKYRNTLSNLAHSLKTPLAVMKGVTDQLNNSNESRTQSQGSETLAQQIERMDEIIKYQLSRAVAGAQGHMLASVNVKIGIEKIISALEKVYQSKCIDFHFACDEQARFYGDEGDFMEIMGNLLDNACKWTSSKVEVEVTYQTTKDACSLMLKVSDNGPGIKPSMYQDILSRGQRLDEKTEGQGIGLSVVSELVHQYDGSITISESDDNGATFTCYFDFKRL